MTVIHAATRARLTEESRPDDKFWFIATGVGTVVVGYLAHQVRPTRR